MTSLVKEYCETLGQLNHEEVVRLAISSGIKVTEDNKYSKEYLCKALAERYKLDDLDIKVDELPREYIDPVSLLPLLDPVAASDGHLYNKDTLKILLRQNLLSPMTRERLTDIETDVENRKPIVYIKNKVDEYMKKHGLHEYKDGKEIMEDYIRLPSISNFDSPATTLTVVDNKLVSGHEDGTVIYWTRNFTPERSRQFAGAIRAYNHLPNGEIYVAYINLNYINKIDGNRRKIRIPLKNAFQESDMTILNNGTLVVSRDYDVISDSVREQFDRGIIQIEGSVWALAKLEDNRIVVGTEGGELYVTDENQEEKTVLLTLPEDVEDYISITAITTTPDGRIMVSGNTNGKITVWIETIRNHYRIIKEFYEDEFISSLAIIGNKLYSTIGDTHNINVYDIENIII